MSLSDVDECPRCAGLQRARPRAVGWCPGCLRWQFLATASHRLLAGATLRHLVCVECGQATWCRDILQHPDARRCAHYAHVHEPGECPGAVSRDTGVDPTTWRLGRLHARRKRPVDDV